MYSSHWFYFLPQSPANLVFTRPSLVKPYGAAPEQLTMNKLILIMIDGISAEIFAQRKSWMPNMHALADQGMQIQALAPEVCGTSFPGRASMIVGRPAAEHGIYGNKIWDESASDGNGEGEFRWSNPYDILTPTIASFAKAAGRDVANVGFGMVRPEDCNVYCSPWWVDDVLNRARNDEPHPTDARWTMQGIQLDPNTRIAALADAGIEINIVNPSSDKAAKLSLAMLADQKLIEIAAGLASSEQAPDLIMLEIAITDYYLHSYGSDHPLTEWSLRTADAQVGLLMDRLRQAGTLDDYNFAIMSDHGHGPMRDAIYCDQL
jgi:predicted AlkP superfamily pyrophosphatase or phosphodiesterase